MLTAEDRKAVDDGLFYKNFKDSKFWPALVDTLQAYVRQASEELLRYGGRDADHIYRMFVEVEVRKRFARFMASRIETEIGKVYGVADEHGLDFDQLLLRRMIDGE